MYQPAILALSDGTVFHGKSIGAEGLSVGEVVFNTSMTGYQEILTDPSYAKQIVTLTYPHVGNVGVNEEDEESRALFLSGLVIRDLPPLASSWRKQHDLSDYLASRGCVGIADIDTRKLTRILRDKGAQNGCVMAGADADAEKALTAAREFGGLQGLDLASEVSTSEHYEWTEPLWHSAKPESDRWNVVAYDYGIKRNILRYLVEFGCKVTVVPATTPVEEVLAMKPHGVFLSNGPGDPEPCDYAYKTIQTLVEKQVPTFGICLGCQLLALACGAKTIKMKFGHHGANHPVIDLDTKRVMISSQNHCYAVDEKTLPVHLRATHRSLFDKTLQGVEHTESPAFAFQGHPEASPGPHDVSPLFERFIQMMEKHTHSAQLG